jgi:hypothetical protein
VLPDSFLEASPIMFLAQILRVAYMEEHDLRVELMSK